MAYMNAQITQLPEYTPATWDAEVGRRIKELLIGRATQAQLGAVIGLNQHDISKRVNGRIPWKGSELGDVAAALGVSVAILYGEKQEDPSFPGPTSLPDLDSNQEPAGLRLAPITSPSERSPKGLPSITCPKTQTDFLAQVTQISASR